MKRLSIFLLAFGFVLTGLDVSKAQSKRADDGIYLKARLGLSTYGGDRDGDTEGNPFELDVSEKFQEASYSLGLEVGKVLNRRWSVGLAYQLAKYTEILDDFRRTPGVDSPGEGAPDLDQDESKKVRHTPHALLRFDILPNKRVSPYLHGGLGLTIGKLAELGGDSSTELGFGPLVGLGFDFVVSNNASLFLELTGYSVFGDDKVDLADPAAEANEYSFDMLGFYGFGLRYSFNPACEAPEIRGIDGPDRVAVGEPVTYTVRLNDDACQPTDLTWDLGDGTTAQGLTVTHTFNTPGDYNVMVNAVNSAGTATGSKAVEVFDPCPVASQIVTITTNPPDPIINESVGFSADVRGTDPVTYAWDFGDGSTGEGATPSHTYAEPGEYTVTLTCTNCGGSDTRELAVVVTEFRCGDITELTSVFFSRNSAELDDEAKTLLDENVAVLQECPDLLARLDGYADRTERRPLRLSENRAKSVEQYYVDAGIAPTRLSPRGLGRDPLTGKGVDGRRNRRVDTIIVDSFE